MLDLVSVTLCDIEFERPHRLINFDTTASQYQDIQHTFKEQHAAVCRPFLIHCNTDEIIQFVRAKYLSKVL